MKHIIDTDELEKLKRMNRNGDAIIYLDDLRKLIANSPQSDGMVLVPSEPTKEMLIAGCESGLSMEVLLDDTPYATDKAVYKAMLSAYKPQVDVNTPPDVYDIVVDTGDGIYHTAEVVHFQQKGSKRMIQVRLGEPQADDVRKDAERWNMLCNLWLLSTELTLTQNENGGYSIIQTEPVENEIFGALEGETPEQAVDQAIDKARE